MTCTNSFSCRTESSCTNVATTVWSKMIETWMKSFLWRTLEASQVNMRWDRSITQCAELMLFMSPVWRSTCWGKMKLALVLSTNTKLTPHMAIQGQQILHSWRDTNKGNSLSHLHQCRTQASNFVVPDFSYGQANDEWTTTKSVALHTLDESIEAVNLSHRHVE